MHARFFVFGNFTVVYLTVTGCRVMGAVIGRPRRAIVLVMGLDNSGKTTVVNCLRKEAGHGIIPAAPSVGVTVKKIPGKSVGVTMCDVSGL